MLMIPILLLLFVSVGYLSFHFVVVSTDGKRVINKFSSDISFIRASYGQYPVAGCGVDL